MSSRMALARRLVCVHGKHQRQRNYLQRLREVAWETGTERRRLIPPRMEETQRTASAVSVCMSFGFRSGIKSQLLFYKWVQIFFFFWNIYSVLGSMLGSETSKGGVEKLNRADVLSST